MTERLLTPSKITAWLDCAHALTLQLQVDDELLVVPRGGFGEMAQMLLAKGLAHEAACLAHYRSTGRSVFEVPPHAADDGETFAQWVDRVGNPMADGHDVIYQMPFVHDGVRGIADFLIRVDDPATGRSWYEPVDAKLARKEAKPGHVLQLCFYADAITATTGTTPENLHIWLGSGVVETVRLSDVAAYWRRLRRRLADVMALEHQALTVAEPCGHCAFCSFAHHCEAQWRAADSLVFVAGIRTVERDVLDGSGVSTTAALAELTADVAGLRPERRQRLHDQASLQVLARGDQDAPPPYERLEPADDDTIPSGFGALPEPDDGDVFLDYEGHPFWTAEAGLFFLFGLLTRSPTGGWTYEARWAHDKAGEGDQTRALVEYLHARRVDHPGMHVYHYNHTERSALERLAAEHGTDEVMLAALVDTGMFVDLFAVVQQALLVGAESYGLKHVERLTRFIRSHEIDSGSGAVVEFDHYMVDRDSDRLRRIARYNEDDVRATLALRDWLITQRPVELPWRHAAIERGESTYPEIDAQVIRLHEFEPGTPEHRLGDLLGYWLRERRAVAGAMLAKTALDLDSQLDEPTVVAGLEFVEHVERLGRRGQPITPSLALRFPTQDIGRELLSSEDGPGPGVIYPGGDGMIGYASVCALDVDAGRLELVLSKQSQQLGVVPTSIVFNDWVSARPKPEALAALAAAVLDPDTNGPANPAAMALLRPDRPSFAPGHGPPEGVFGDQIEEIQRLAVHLDGSYLAIQGPPGTGKTHTGAYIVRALVKAHKRVGITAMSHHAIDNLLDKVVEVFTKEGDLHELHAVRKVGSPRAAEPGVTYATKNKKCATGDHGVIAGTTWLFSSEDMRAAPVDVLIIDEAGQLSLADAMAAMSSAHNVILLGDPMQLPQVAQGSHPPGAGASVLEHVLGEHHTIPPDRGVFLSTTWRMHPDVSSFISEQIYEGRLRTHEHCARQSTGRGTGLRWLPAVHSQCSTESPEEAEIVVAAVADLIGVPWTDFDGLTTALTVDDVMVVAPYNDQVNLLRERLAANHSTRGVRVGTVDKFQGQEAPVVFFSMTASTSADIPRGADFLFSKNRLNVAISRARALAYVVCTEDLLDSPARDVEQMKLIATLCSFVERCTPQATAT